MLLAMRLKASHAPAALIGTTETTSARAHSQRLAYRIDELAALLGVSRSFIYLEIAAGRLRPIKLGRCTVIRAEDVRQYLDSR
jgi:excisionase family DNA binding protein